MKTSENLGAFGTNGLKQLAGIIINMWCYLVNTDNQRKRHLLLSNSKYNKLSTNMDMYINRK